MIDREAAILEIEERNRLRAATLLPLLEVKKALREAEVCANEVERREFLEENTSQLRTIAAGLLQAERQRRGNINWKPNGFFGNFLLYRRAEERLFALAREGEKSDHKLRRDPNYRWRRG